jgi:hypothetical protein
MKQIYYIFILSFLVIGHMQPSFAASAASAAGSVEDPRIAAIAGMSSREKTAILQSYRDAHSERLSREDVLYVQALNTALYGELAKKAAMTRPKEDKLRKNLEEYAERCKAAQLLDATFLGGLDYLADLKQEIDSKVKTEPQVKSEFESFGFFSGFWPLINQDIVEKLRSEKHSLEYAMGDLMWGKFFLGRLLPIWMSKSPYLFAKYPEVRRIYEETIFVMEDAMDLLMPFMSDAYKADKLKMAYNTAESKGKPTFKRLIGTDLEITNAMGMSMRVPLKHRMQAVVQRQFTPYQDFFKTDGYCFAYTLPSGFMGKLGGFREAEAKALVAEFNAQKEGMAEAIEAQLKAEASAERVRLKEVAKCQKADARAVERLREAEAAAAVDALCASLEDSKTDKGSGKKGKKAGKAKAEPVATSAPDPSTGPSFDASMTSTFGGAGGVAAVPVHAGPGSTSAIANAMDGERALFAAKAAEKKRLTEITLRLWALQDDESEIGMERPVVSRTGLKSRQKHALATLLGVKIGGQIPGINTLDWDQLVYLLDGLGFKQTDRDKFYNAEKQQFINLHAIHYDDYRLNHAVQKIILTQLESYGLTQRVLNAMLA